jgi:hypothetical protein
LRRVSSGVKPKDCQMSFAKVVFAPLGSALTTLMNEKKYVCGSEYEVSDGCPTDEIFFPESLTFECSPDLLAFELRPLLTV